MVQERASLEAAFNRYDADGSNSLEVDELTQLLEDLGLPGPVVHEKSRELNGCDMNTFVYWWRSEREHLCPAASAILSFVTARYSMPY
jgi:hypothetical protein